MIYVNLIFSLLVLAAQFLVFRGVRKSLKYAGLIKKANEDFAQAQNELIAAQDKHIALLEERITQLEQRSLN